MSASDSQIVYALDFDGVICDSVGESSQTALRAGLQLWPDLPIPVPFPQFMLDAMREIRPVIETGYENILLARLISQTTADNVKQKFIEPVLADWPSIRDDAMTEWDVTKEQLVEIFGGVRDKWIADDIDAWITANSLYVVTSHILCRYLYNNARLLTCSRPHIPLLFPA